MPEWWTYTLSDFLLFSPRTYYRLIERHNAAVWPWQIVTLGLGLATAGLLLHRAPWQGRLVSGVLAALWSWVAWSFVWRRYAVINWAATYLTGIFVVEVLLLLWAGVVRGTLSFHWRRDAAGATGLGLLLLSLGVYPLLAPLAGRGWRQSEIFGVAPDPTVLATVGLLLLVEGAPPWRLLIAPVLWCAVSGATLLALGSPEAWILVPAVLLPLGAAAARGRL